jgi:outer membrane protein assembly factor BamB
MLRFSLIAVLSFATALSARAENWPEFRGPTGQGIYAGKNLPIEWSPTKNVAWVQPIPGKGWSSPIVQDGRIYLTSAVPIADTMDLSPQAICLDADSGEQIWKTEVFRHAANAKIHTKNSHASPTPITDGKRLYVHFGHQGTACLDLTGKILWRNTDLRYNPVHGNGGSPILAGDRLVFSVDGSDQQFVCALDTADGKLAWKTDRQSEAGDKTFSFSTPLLITANGKPQIVSPASNAVMAYDPADGKEIWRVKYNGYSVIPRPVFGHGMVFISTGYGAPVVMAIKVDGAAGDVTKSHVVWSVKKGGPHTPSLLLVGAELYMVSDGGLASCLDARTGKFHWSERVGGGFSASPFYADGKIYLQSEQGVTTVLNAGTTYESLAASKLGERTFACYAVADGAIYLRTESKLYRFQAK